VRANQRLRWVVAVLAASFIAQTHAAVPDISRAQFLHEVLVNYYLPRIGAFARLTPGLTKSVDALCESPTNDNLNAARAAWTATMLAWEDASAIAFGPLLARRSVYRIDYWPARANLIAQALRDAPTTVKGLELVGAPAKGIPAIEWLLWTPAEHPDLLGDPARCAYVRLLTLDVDEEAQGLNQAFVAFAAAGLPTSAADDAFAGLFNLAYGGVEQLGDKKMDKPAKIGGGKDFPRVLSGQTTQAWNVQWSSIRTFLVGDADVDSANLHAYLRAHALQSAAQSLQRAADVVTRALHATQRATPASAIEVAKELRALRASLANDVAGALEVPVQFDSNDGD
jgi:predicted lipoprotein